MDIDLERCDTSSATRIEQIQHKIPRGPPPALEGDNGVSRVDRPAAKNTKANPILHFITPEKLGVTKPSRSTIRLLHY